MQNKPHSNENLSFHFDSLGLPFRDHLQSILRISKWFFKLQKKIQTQMKTKSCTHHVRTALSEFS